MNCNGGREHLDCNKRRADTNLVILGGELVQTLLNDVVSVQVLDEDYNVKAERNNYRVNLNIVSSISLSSFPVSAGEL
jgi:hypothetical protein